MESPPAAVKGVVVKFLHEKTDDAVKGIAVKAG
jgi:hypothetical protein